VPPAGWNVEIQFEEDESLTSAASLLQLPEGTALHGRGQARRNPADPAQPQIGEEIAAARALSDLVHQLLDKAAAEIEDVTHKPAHLTG
jgi:Rv2632c-like